MTEAGQGFALRTYLFGEPANGDNDSIDTIARSLRERGPARTATYGIERLGTGALGVLDREVAGIVDGVLEYDLGTLLIDGWSTYSRVRDAAQRSLERPGQTEFVELKSHTVTWTFEPKVDVVVDGVVKKTLRVALTVDFKLQPLELHVRDGCLEAVQTTTCVVAATLALEDRPILPERETRIEDFAALLPLHKPIRIVESPAGANAG